MVLSRLYQVLSFAVVLLGFAHMMATFRLPAGPSASKVWFFGSGMAIALVGAVNLLNRRYGREARGLRIACVGANIAITAFAAVAGALTGASVPERLVMMAVLSAVLLLATVRSASLDTVGAADSYPR